MSLGTILTPYYLDDTNILNPFRVNLVIDYQITGLSLKDQTNKSMLFTPPTKKHYLANIFFTDRKLFGIKNLPSSKKIYDTKN